MINDMSDIFAMKFLLYVAKGKWEYDPRKDKFWKENKSKFIYKSTQQLLNAFNKTGAKTEI